MSNWLKDIEKNPPTLYCVNGITESNKTTFEKFKNNIIFPKIKNASMPKIAYGYEKDEINPDDPIDLVLLWVDMNDPSWRAQYKKYYPDKIKRERYDNSDELELCLASVCKYMPWIRTIYIVTECALPDYALNNPKVVGIDQSDILREECAKPTFNSNAIESCMHRIPNLSETFMFGCDDFMVGKPIKKSDWFKDNLPLCVLGAKELPPPTFFWHYLYNAVNITGDYFGSYAGIGAKTFVPTHQFSILRKAACEMAWDLFHSELSQMVQSRNREPHRSQITFHLFAQLVGAHTGTMKIKADPAPHNRLYNHKTYMGGNVKNDDQKQWLRNIEKRTPTFYCVNSLAPPTTRFFQDFKRKMLERINK